MNRLEKLLKAILATVGIFMITILIVIVIHFMPDISTDIILALAFILLVFYFYIIQKDESPNN